MFNSTSNPLYATYVQGLEDGTEFCSLKHVDKAYAVYASQYNGYSSEYKRGFITAIEYHFGTINPKIMFHFSRYWHSWSRVLSDNHPRGPFVEVNLTPIDGCGSSTWESDVIPIVIRVHGTARSDKDIETNELPREVRQTMVRMIGEQLTNRLLTEDFLSKVDLRKCTLSGGSPLHQILI